MMIFNIELTGTIYGPLGYRLILSDTEGVLI